MASFKKLMDVLNVLFKKLMDVLNVLYDSYDNLIANQTTDATHISYVLPPRANDTCQYLEFRVTADQCPNPENGFIQTEGATIGYREPNIDISPVTAEFDNNRTVLVSWTPNGSGIYRVRVTDWHRGDLIRMFYGNPPFHYTLILFGQFNLDIAVSPSECAEDPGFTYHTSISFTVVRPTLPAPTDTDTEVSDQPQPSGTLASYPSLLLAVAAIIPLLKWQH